MRDHIAFLLREKPTTLHDIVLFYFGDFDAFWGSSVSHTGI